MQVRKVWCDTGSPVHLYMQNQMPHVWSRLFLKAGLLIKCMISLKDNPSHALTQSLPQQLLGGSFLIPRLAHSIFSNGNRLST